MRLVCPNCSAQYEVDASMIPEDGRDVQCSNCGHTWFELPAPAAGLEADEDNETRVVTRPMEDLGREDFENETPRKNEPDEAEEAFEEEDKRVVSEAVRAITEASEEADAESREDASDHGGDADVEDEDEEEGPEPAPAAASSQKRRPADAADLDVLREEAERELSKRAMPPDTLETQTDMGLDEVRNRATPSRALRARMAHMGEEPESEEPPAPASSRNGSTDKSEYSSGRRDLLPDIDEINSTLKPTSRRAEASPEMEAARRSGFRIGFILPVLLAVAAVFAYAKAPAIARALPETEPTLIRFVDSANALRDWIDGFLQN